MSGGRGVLLVSGEWGEKKGGGGNPADIGLGQVFLCGGRG